MTTYIKNAKEYATYVDAKTRFKIARGEVAKVDVLTVGMRDRIRNRGLLVVEQAEYDAYLASKNKAAPAQVAPVDVPVPAVEVGKDMEPEAPAVSEPEPAAPVEEAPAATEPEAKEPEAPAKEAKVPGYKKLMGKK